MIHINQRGNHSAAWCLHCEKAIDVKQIVFASDDGVGQACPFDDCDGGAIDLHWWSSDDWPKSVNASYPDLPTVGESYPLYGDD